jgi:hypothetical protein
MLSGGRICLQYRAETIPTQGRKHLIRVKSARFLLEIQRQPTNTLAMDNKPHRGLTGPISFICGYFLLLAVLLGTPIPFIGIPLALLFETPVSGYYVHVMREELQTLFAKENEWTGIPQWSLRLLPELMWLGMGMNAIMMIYAVIAAAPLGLAFAVASLNHIQLFPIGFPLIITALVLLLPGLWVFALMLPLAVARFAWSSDIRQAFHFCTIARLAARRCRLAILSAIVFLSASVLNMTLTALMPEVMPLSEPTIEFISMVIWSKLVAHSFGGKMSDSDRDFCPTWLDPRYCKPPVSAEDEDNTG